MKKLLLSFCLLTAFALPAYAEQLPMVVNDSRIQMFNYTPNDVYSIKTKMGYSSLIQFEEGEIIHDDGGLGVGEAKDWSIGVKGNNIFLKPVNAMLQPSNMLIVTNKRTYAFTVQTTTGDDITYVARFKYPDEMASQSLIPAKPINYQRVKQGDTTYLIDAKINTDYTKRGNLELAPTAMWDDGLFTHLKYDNAKELPSVYKIMPDNTESLVNTHIEDDTLIIHEVNRLYRLRLGQAVAELANARYKDSEFNRTGTSQLNTVRAEQ